MELIQMFVCQCRNQLREQTITFIGPPTDAYRMHRPIIGLIGLLGLSLFKSTIHGLSKEDTS